MNPNMPYGQQMPMQPPYLGRNGSYTSLPHPVNMRPHPGYQQYYQPPNMSPYPPQYPPNYYPYQPHHMQPQPHLVPPARHSYYPQAPPPPPHTPQHPHLHPPLPVSPHLRGQASPRPTHMAPPSMGPPIPSPIPMSTASPHPVPPSPVSSIPSTSNTQQDESSRVSSPAPLSVQSAVTDASSVSSPFHPPLPWLSVSDHTFPQRAPRRKRKITRSALATEPVEFPLVIVEDVSKDSEKDVSNQIENEEEQAEELEVMPTPTPSSTTMVSDAPSDGVSSQPTTPSSSAVPAQSIKSHVTPTQAKSARIVMPIIPALPILPQIPTLSRKPHSDSVISDVSESSENVKTFETRRESMSSDTQSREPHEGTVEEAPKPISPPAPPKSWADLVRSKAVPLNVSATSSTGHVPNGLAPAKSESLSEVLNEISSASSDPSTRVAFLQPRGLVNTGNMCYMNSVLQMLVFCVPFYDFLDKVARRAAHAFKSDTPLIDAMILFMHEYNTIDSAGSVEKLKLRLKPDDYEKYGESFIPEYVYQVIRQLPRFRDMRRGHQQDAQEFLGFLLEELHEECAHVMRNGTSGSSGRSTPVGSTSNMSELAENDGVWTEVGPKQKPAVTRSSGSILTESPITNIFGGKLRSELKVTGNKLSVTLEPYQPLQLDIGSPQVSNILDALKGLTKPESMQGDFHSARGPKTTATKQVFIESLPPVLILHLKRFHYDSTTKRAEKIWKKVGYPLELEIPKEVFPTQTRNKLAAHGGLPKYKLIGVIYHHGKNANGGHYTVDIRRQDGREWIRLDDTVIRRIRSEDVAEGGSEEDPKILAAALERHNQQNAAGNRFERFDQDDEQDEEEPEKLWSQVNGHSRSKSTLNINLNGSGTPAKEISEPPTPSQKPSSKDNKVAYLLFYQKISA